MISQPRLTWPYRRYSSFSKIVHKAASKWFLMRGHETSPKHPYILASWRDWPKNIILPEVSQFIRDRSEKQRADGTTFPLHKYLHHGLSSQALLFNLIGPLLVWRDLAPLQNVLKRRGIELPGANADTILEFEDRKVFNEGRGQPTSIDLAIFSRDGVPPIFIEAKFVEREFGGCSLYQQGDCDGRNPATNLDLCYLHHIVRHYWTLMQKYGLHHGKIGTDTLCILAPHYQFFRGLLFALEKGGSFILLSDERSPVFFCNGPDGQRGLMPLLVELLPDELRTKVAGISIQELVAEIELSGRHEWIGEFIVKYGLTPINEHRT